LEAYTSGRPSGRTHARHGLGPRIARALPYVHKSADLPVGSLAEAHFIHSLFFALETAHRLHAADEARWKELLHRFSGPGIDGNGPSPRRHGEQEIDALWHCFQRAPNISHVQSNDHIDRAVHDIAEQVFPRSTLGEAVAEARRFLLCREAAEEF